MATFATGQEGPSPQQIQEFEVTRSLKPIDALSVEEAEKEIIAMRGDEKGPLNVKNDPYHDVALHRLNRLYEKKYPQKSPEEKEKEIQVELEGIRVQTAELQAQRDDEKAEADFQKAEGHLKALWGSHAYEANLALAKRVISSFASEEDVKLLDDSGLSNDPEFADLLFRVGERLQAAERKQKK